MNNKLVLARKRYAITIVLILVFSMSGCNTKDVQLQLENSRNNYLKTNETAISSSNEINSSSSASDIFSSSEVLNNSSRAVTVSSVPCTTETEEKQNEAILIEELNDFHDNIQPQNPTPDISKEFDPITDTSFAGGNGTQTNPYIITTPEELVYFSEKINIGEMNNGVYFALGADIDMSGVDFSPIGNSTYRFSSNFDGRGYTVSNLTPKLTYEDFGNNANYSCGFFGIVGNAEIKNLCLESVNITYTYESDYFTEMGILAACVYPTRECKITDCIVNGRIKAEVEVLLVGGIVGDIFVTDDAKLRFERLQSNTKLQVRSDSVNAGAVSGSLLGRGEEKFSDICAQSEIIHNSIYSSYIGAFGGASNTKGCVSISNCFFKINTNKKFADNIHLLIGGIIDSYQPKGTFNFTNVFGAIDSSTQLYDIPSANAVREENCSFTNALPSDCSFNTEIWDISDPSTPFIKFNFGGN